MKSKEYHFYMKQAVDAAEMSHAVRKKVGACVVSKHRGIYIGYNGMGEGLDNTCEYTVYMSSSAVEVAPFDQILEEWPYEDEFGRFKLVTKPGCLHAELNCLSKMLKEGVSAEDATLFVTLSPCTYCSCMIAAAGISNVIYLEEYRDTTGIDILRESEVGVTKYNPKF